MRTILSQSHHPTQTTRPPTTARRRPSTSAASAILTLASLLHGAAQAQPAISSDLTNSPSVYAQGSWAPHGTDTATLGVTLPWTDWHSQLWGGEVRGYWDFYISRWSFNGNSGYDTSTVVGVTPTFRLRPDGGQSPWFWEAGVGATMADRLYKNQDEEFSTRFNFASHLGLGINLGTLRQHELSVRIQHISNASIKQPNPGENFVQLRYALHF